MFGGGGGKGGYNANEDNGLDMAVHHRSQFPRQHHNYRCTCVRAFGAISVA